MTADRNLLTGILAVQLGFVTRDQLVDAMYRWLLDKARPLAELLPLAEAQRGNLEHVVQVYLCQHDGDVQKSLAALSSVESVVLSLRTIRDADLHASLGAISDRTVAQPHVHRSQDASSRFRILRPHARGGLGEVFVAEDMELRRQVALKEIPRDKDRGDSRARFIFEAEITGSLEHPGIVPVYGLGHYADGRPYYAMRFIKGDHLGVAIKRLHTQRKTTVSTQANSVTLGDRPSSPRPQRVSSQAQFDSLEFRRLLQCFINVCQTVAYAHSRGVLHRDLKPENIMLGKYGETLVVDWGLAKAGASQEIEEAVTGDECVLQPMSISDVIPTQYGSTIGTPAYMSPEQAEGKLDELGPASDVYSLGATLYHLLVGEPPNANCDLLQMNLRCLNGDIPAPRTLNPAIPKPLEAICQKAMALQPKDRYASAQELAADIEQWLADEPVSAMAEPFTVKARRWARKHPGTVASLAASLIVGVLGLGAGLYFVEAERQRTIAQEKQTAQALVLADNRFDIALTALNEMVFGMQSLLQQRPGTLEVRKELLAKARPGLNKLLAEAATARGADRTLLWSHFRLGDLAMEFGDSVAALVEYQAGHEMAALLAKAEPENVTAQRELSISFGKLGDVTLEQGNAPAALEYYRQSLEVSQRLANADPKNVLAQSDLSTVFERLGDVALQLDKVPEALDYHRRSLEVSQRLADADPSSGVAQRNLSVSFDKLGDVMQQTGNVTEALEYYRKGLEICQQLANADPKNAEAQRDLSISFDRIGDVTLKLGNIPEAHDYYRWSLKIRQRLAEADPNSAIAQRDLSVSYYKLGDVTLKLGNVPSAIDYCRKSIEVSQRLSDADPKNAQSQIDLFFGYFTMGIMCKANWQFAQAQGWFEKALAKYEQIRSEGWIHKPEKLIDNKSYQEWLDNTRSELTRCAKTLRSIDDLDFALKQPAEEVAGLLEARLRVLANKGDANGCIVTAKAMTSFAQTDAVGLFQTASLWSICAGLKAESQNEFADMAMDYLKRAVAAGFNDVKKLKTNKDLDLLRNREDFKKLLQELEEKGKS